MADLNDFDRPILSDNYVDCLDTLRENIKRVKSLADSNTAVIAGLGSMSHNNFTVDDVAPTTPTPKVGDRWVRPSTGDEMILVPNTDGSKSWFSPLANISSEMYLKFVAKAGDTMTGPLQINNLGWNSLKFYNANAPAGKRGGAVGVDDAGYVCFRALNDNFSVERGNVYFAHDTLEWQIATATKGGGRIWHSGNDGVNSGLDADLLRGYYPSWDNVANTVVIRRDTGRIDCGQLVANDLWVNGLTMWNENGKWRTNNPIHTGSYVRVEDVFYCRDIYWLNNGNQWWTYWNVHTDGEMQCKYFRCSPEIQISDGSGSKYVRINGGNFEVVNNAYSAVIMQLSDSGRFWAGQGYLSKQGMYAGAGANIHNWFWYSPNIEIWVDNSRVGWINISTSDERIKKDIEPMPLLLAEVFNKIAPIKFRWRDVGVFVDDGKDYWGFSAQNLLQVAPQTVRGDVEEVASDGEILPAGVNETAILAQLVLQVQDLLRRMAALEAA